MKKLTVMMIVSALATMFALISGPSASAAEFKVQVNALEGFTPKEERKVLEAIRLVERVVASPEFHARVAAFSYAGENKFVDNNGLTNEQIYQRLMAQPLQLEVTLYSASIWKKLVLHDSTVGYTTPGTTRTWINRKFFNRFTPASIAGNFVHEWLHKLGFDHDFNRTARRPYSVPYGIGALVEELARGESQLP